MCKRKKQRVPVFLFTLVVLLVAMTGTAFAKVNSKSSPLPPLDYVALGDSLAAGQTPYSSLDKSYAAYLADKLREEGVLGKFNNFGVSGYTTSDVRANLPSQLTQLTNAEIVTLDVGANDILPSIAELQTSPQTALPKIQAAITEYVPKNIAAIISAIKTANPNAKVYVMGYYNAFPYVTQPMQGQLLDILHSLNSSIEIATKSCGATYVDTEVTMDKHLTKYLPNPSDIHPDLLGYKAITQDFWDVIKVDFLRGLN